MNTLLETRGQIHFTKKETGVAVLLLDCPGKLNSIGSLVMDELKEALRTIHNDPSIKSVVLMSAKPDNFIIGADLYEIRKASSKEQLHTLSKDGQETLHMVASLKKPVVAAINGTCLGGGLELALAAHWRIATDVASTLLGLPETRLGIIPGLGGTQRLPRLVGLKNALAMILSAEPVQAREACSMGLVDELVSPNELMAAAEKRAAALAADAAPIAGRLTESLPPDYDPEKTKKLFAMTERSVRIKTRGNYPAQTQALEAIKVGLEKGLAEGLAVEASIFADLAFSEQSANLISLFFATDFARQSAASLATKFNENVSSVAIIGGGTMGGTIAQLTLLRGIDVVLKVRNGKEKVVEEMFHSFMERHEQQKSSLGKLKVTSEWSALSGVTLVLEAIAEDLEVKRELLKDIEKAVPAHCVIATNTSSLALADLASSLEKTDRFVGLHFFQPVDKMPAVEIVALKSTARGSIARAADYVTKLSKQPVMVKDGAGFLINRLLTCYLFEAAQMSQESIPLSWIEESAIDFGMPMGPIEVMDEVGQELYSAVAASLHNSFGDRMQPPRVLQSVQELGIRGKKEGCGIYSYDDSGRKKDFNPQMTSIPEIVLTADKASPEKRHELAERLIFPMIDEAARCLEEKIVAKPREIDVAIVHGIGFPPFRGGILKYADHVGLKHVVTRLNQIYARGDAKRSVSPMLEKYADEGRGFYSLSGKEEE